MALPEPAHYRTIWISDFHLGTPNARTDALLDFLKDHEADTWYLVGDIFDGWALKRSWQWDQVHNDVIQKLLRKVRKGARMTYIPGNHDDFARQFAGQHFGGIAVQLTALHATADGKQLLVLHGDEFDGVVRHMEWLSKFGAWAYELTLTLNRYFNAVRYRLGLPYWSLSAWLKQKAKRAVQFVNSFGEMVAHEAQKSEVDGVVCGHIHHAEIREIEGVMYYNCGDWVESCTALVEHHDGRMELLSWAHRAGNVKRSALPLEAGDGLPALPIPFPTRVPA